MKAGVYMIDSTSNIYKKISDTEMVLYCGNTLVIFDAEDYPLVSTLQWSVGSHSYVTSGSSKNQVLMHRLIMNVNDEHEIDHINRIKVDNRKCNLRLCTHGDNARNKPAQANSKTSYKGICQLPNGRYQAQIYVDHKPVYLGQYADIEEAVHVYDSALKIIAGEYACVNNKSSVLDKNIFQRLLLIHHKRRMTLEIRKRVFELRNNGLTVKEIAGETGFSQSAIRRLFRGQTYKPKSGDAE